MKRKIYTCLYVGITLISCFANINANGQNQEYWRETFVPVGPSGDPGATSTLIDYEGVAGTWKFLGVYITTGMSCITTTNRHIRSTSAAVPTPDTAAYVITPKVAFGIRELRLLRSRASRRITVYKTSDTAANTTNWVLAVDLVKSSLSPNPLCTDTAVLINDASAKRLRIVFEKLLNNDIDSIGLTSVNPIVPIKFSSINAQLANGFVKVSWNIQSEINTLKYEVEKSTDGRNFTAIGSTAANNAGKYSWIDNNLSTNDSYYRIKGIDKDGAFTYSTIVRINSGKKTPELAITPNPVQGGILNLQLSNVEKGAYTLQLYSNNGAMVFSKTITNEGGAFSKSVELPAAVVKGVYQLQLVNGTTRFSKSIIVQ